MDNEKQPKTAQKFVCKICYFKCSKLCNWKQHVLTLKHQNNEKWITMDNEKQPKTAEKIVSELYICECGKNYQYSSGLSKHKKKCKSNSTKKNYKEEFEDMSDKEIIMMLIKDNKDMRDTLIDISKNTNQINNGTITTNSHNQSSFNLNLFLNETCKDAINIQEFVSSIKLSLEDLEFTGKNGYVDGISNIVCKTIKQLEQNKRPFHCTDSKREVLYIKDNNKWEKETDKKPILTNAIKTIANQNIKNIIQWKNKNPDCTNPNSKKNDVYLNIVSNSMSGISKEESEKNINKIISNVAKEISISR
jgi:hypothetical protein